MIYYCFNLESGMGYVGQTVHRTIKSPMYRHSRSNMYFGKALKFHGQKAFKWVILSNSRDNLDDLEIYWIKELGTLYPGGYNLNKGGGERNVSLSLKGISVWNEGLCTGPMTPEHIRNRVNSLRTITPELVQAIRKESPYRGHAAWARELKLTPQAVGKVRRYQAFPNEP